MYSWYTDRQYLLPIVIQRIVYRVIWGNVVYCVRASACAWRRFFEVFIPTEVPIELVIPG